MKLLNISIALVAMSGVALGDSHMEKKKDAPKDAPKDAKKDAPKDAPKDAKKEAPKAPAEVEAMAKTAVGTYKCKGDGFGMDGKKEAITGTVKVKLDMNKFWLVENIEVKGSMAMNMIAYTTYDAGAKKWRRVMIEDNGGYLVGTSDGVKDNKLDWTMDASGPMGSGQFRDHMDMTDAAKTGTKMWGEMSMDKGKTWNKAYEWTCKK